MRLMRFALVAAAACFLSALSFISRPGINAQLWLMLSLPVLLITWLALLAGLFSAQGKAHRLKYLQVLLLAPASLVLAVFAGSHVRDYLFYRDLPRMKEVVALIQSGSIPLAHGPIKLPDKYQSLAYGTHADKDEQGVLTVTFFVGGGFPVKHHCYLFRSDGVMTPEVRRDWSSGFRREKQWFEVSD